MNSSSDYSDSTNDETSSSSSSSSDAEDDDDDTPITRKMFYKLLNRDKDHEAKMQQSQRYTKSCITAPNKYLVKGNHINHKQMTKTLYDLGDRKGLPELHMNNLCSFVDAFTPMVKQRYKRGKPLTNAEYNWLLTQYFSKDVKNRYLNENIEFRKVSSDTFLKELSILIYGKTPTVQSIIEELEEYIPDTPNILVILSDLKKIICKVPSNKWKTEKRNKILFRKVSEYLTHSQNDSFRLIKRWDHKTGKFLYPDFYEIRNFLEERESDINGYLYLIQKQKRRRF